MALTGLRIAPGLELDADYVGGGTFALLAKKGAGKTYLARVMAEEMWAAKIPFVFLDPMGAAWGLRSSADGDDEGIPVAIFGGDHGDAPLERGGGALMADLVVDEGLSMVLDLSALGSRAAERQFAHDFLERLYRRNSALVHLLIDEADLFAPQVAQAGDRPLLGVTENIVRRGRNRGIGITLITQRPAVLNKDVLTQVDGLVAMRIVGLTDRKAIDEWVKGHGDDEAAGKVKATLSGLENGECWWWVPELDILQRVQVRRARTFDSSPTRKRGEQRRDPKGFADVDMAAIEKTMAATIERAKATDPKELRKEIARLKRDLAARPTEKVVEERVERVEVPVLDDEHVERLEDAVEALGAAASKIITATHEVAAGLGKLKMRAPAPAPARQPAPAPAARAPAAPPPAVELDGDFRPSNSQQRILNALAALEVIGVTMAGKTQLALFSEASPKSSGYTNNLGALRSAGLIDYPAPATVGLTDVGRSYADSTAAPSTGDELQAYVRQLVGASKARLLDQLIAAYPDAIAKDELAELAGVSAKSSGYTNNLGSLRSLGLIDYPSPGYVAALPVLFLEAA
jgi:hypothetical protein